MKATCALCGARSEEEYAIHRYGLGVGPEVWLCNGCGSKPTPTCEDIWDALKKKHLPRSAFVGKEKRR